MTQLPQNSEPLLSMLETVLNSSKAYYLAVPVTSGSRLWKLALRLGVRNIDEVRYTHQREFELEVLNPNVEAARSLAASLRRQHRNVQIINPSILVVGEWSPEDYRSFWKFVVREKVARVYLAPGWEYSHGCVEECVEALGHGIPVFDAAGGKRNEESAYNLVSSAVGQGRDAGLDIQFLEETRQHIKNALSIVRA